MLISPGSVYNVPERCQIKLTGGCDGKVMSFDMSHEASRNELIALGPRAPSNTVLIIRNAKEKRLPRAVVHAILLGKHHAITTILINCVVHDKSLAANIDADIIVPGGIPTHQGEDTLLCMEISVEVDGACNRTTFCDFVRSLDRCGRS